MNVIYIFTFMHLPDTFIQSFLFRLYIFFVSMCVPWELNPQPFALLTQCSTTEPVYIYIYIYTHTHTHSLAPLLGTPC